MCRWARCVLIGIHLARRTEDDDSSAAHGCVVRLHLRLNTGLNQAPIHILPDAPDIVVLFICTAERYLPVIIVQTIKGTHTLNCMEIGIRTYKAWNLVMKSADFI